MSARHHLLRSGAAAIATIATLALLLGTTSAVAAAPATPTTSDPAAAAAGWLARQLVDGTHLRTTYAGTTYDDYGGTADAVLGMSTAKVGGSTISAATAWLAKNADAYTSLSDTSGAPGPYDGSVAKLALVALVTGQDPTDFGGFNLLKALHDDQCTTTSNADGSDFTKPACPAPGAASNIYSSVSESLAILVQARVSGAYAPSSDAVTYFLSLQCPNGGFTGLTSACTTDSDASADETAYAVMALQALGSRQASSQPAALAKAVGWLQSMRTAGGYWVEQGGPDVDTTGLASAALAGAGKGISASRTWLAAQQVTTGPSLGKGASRGALKYQGAFDPMASVKATADALPGLARDGSFATLTDAGVAAGAPVLALRRPTPIKAVVKRGTKQKVVATGFAPDEKVRFALRSHSVGIARANAHGTVRLRFTVPRHTKPVRHVVRLTGLTSRLHATSTSFRVTA